MRTRSLWQPPCLWPSEYSSHCIGAGGSRRGKSREARKAMVVRSKEHTQGVVKTISIVFVIQWVAAILFLPFMLPYYGDLTWIIFDTQRDFLIEAVRIIASVTLPVSPNILFAVLGLLKKYDLAYIICLPAYVVFSLPAFYITILSCITLGFCLQSSSCRTSSTFASTFCISGTQKG